MVSMDQFNRQALDLLTGLQSTGFLKSQSTHYLKMWQQNAKVYWLTENDNDGESGVMNLPMLLAS